MNVTHTGTTFAPVWAWVWNRPLTTLLVALVIVVVSVVLASRLQLRTSFAELLPSADPAVEELHRLAEHVGGTAVMQIAIQSPDRDANLKFAAEVAARVRKLGPTFVTDVTYDVRAEQEFFRDRRFLYAPLEDLVALRNALHSEIDRKRNPLVVDLLDEDSVDEVVARMKQRGAGVHLFPTGYFEADDGRLVVIVCHPPGGLFAERAGERLATATRGIIAELDPKSFEPQMQAGLTGDVMSQIEERAALESDLASATALCVSLVLLVMVVYFGRLRAVPLVMIPALVGVTVAFGVAELLFGYLNASTAFMGSIVVGNGINFPIIVLARYEEERRSGHDGRTATMIALRATMRPTAIAALGAAISYASLMATRFRGFSQFGAIGGIGMIAAWLASMLVLPALIARFDRRSAARPKPRTHGAFSGLVSRLATRAPRTTLILFTLLTIFAVVPLPHYLRDPFEYDFRNLRNRKSVSSGSASLSPVVERVFGETLTPAVVLSDTRAHTGEIRHKILERDRTLPGGPLIGRVATFEDFLPGDAATQDKKLAVLKELRDLLHSPAVRLASDEQRARFAELDETAKLVPVHDDDIPLAIRRQFTELDGTVGRIVAVYHAQAVSVWNGHSLVRIAQLIDRIDLDDGTLVRSSGHAVVFAAMIRSIVHDAPLATLASLGGVALLVLLLTGNIPGALAVLAGLFAGVVWMLGVAAWVGVRTNFLNFIALPITFGIGVDYGINIFLRYRLEGRGRVGRAVRATGGAVALCSLTTIIGYAALMVADNQALKSFGEMAILGEIACVSAALIGLPSYLVLRERRIVRSEDIAGPHPKV